MNEFHNLSLDHCFKELKSSPAGLSAGEAVKRLKQNGFNELARARSLSKTKIFFRQLQNPLVYILLLAAGISWLLGEHAGMAVILVTVAINSLIGFSQEVKVNNSLEMLKKIIVHKTIVLRDGQEKEIDSREIVKGDVIVLRPGYQVPADARIFHSERLEVNEAALTGESMPVEKIIKALEVGTVLAERRNMSYAATSVLSGVGRALVIATGAATEIGRIFNLVKETKESITPLQEKLAHLSKFLGWLAGALCLLIIVVGLIQGRDFLEILLVAIAVAVSAIPEGLAISVTVVLVLGMKEILHREALVRRLVAAETLGSTSVICTDKTGTLTEGNMHVSGIIIGDKEFSPNDLNNSTLETDLRQALLALEIGVLCNNAIAENSKDPLRPEKFSGLPVEIALLKTAYSLGLNREELLKKQPRLAEHPFSSEDKFMITAHAYPHGSYTLYKKGAVEKVLAKASFFRHNGTTQLLSSADRRRIERRHEDLAVHGLRVIAVAVKEIKASGRRDISFDWDKEDSDWEFIGFIALRDPLRADAKDTIRECYASGIRPIMITGDHPQTAMTIAREAGFKIDGEKAISGPELDKLSDEELRILVKKASVYARVTPEHKLRIIRALKANGEVVAMTGDGINDTPALKAADIGICLGSGTDIAREASDLVLLNNSFSTIVKAVEQGRSIFQNIRQSLTYLISDGLSETILVVGSMIAGIPILVVPTQILWINVINDSLPNFSLAWEKGEGLMGLKPIKKTEAIINREMKILILGVGIVRDTLILLVFLWAYRHLDVLGIDFYYLRTMAFAVLAIKSLASIFSLRRLSRSIFKTKFFSNPYLIAAVLASLAMLFAAIYLPFMNQALSTVPLGAQSWILILLSGFINIFMMEVVKHFYLDKHRSERI